MKSLGPLAFVVAAALAAAGCASSHPSAQRSDGARDVLAVRDINRAVDAMRASNGYRFVATVQTDKQATVARGEFQAPDRVHETITVGDRPVAELVSTGTRVVVRDPRTGAWRTQPAATAGTTSDPRAAFAAITKASDMRKDGASYRFRLPKDVGATLVRGTDVSGGEVTGAATIVGGRIASLDFTVSGGGRTLRVNVVYSDVDAAPPVAVPA